MYGDRISEWIQYDGSEVFEGKDAVENGADEVDM